MHVRYINICSSFVLPALPLPLTAGFNLSYWQVEQARPCLVRCKWCSLSSSPSISLSLSLSSYYIKSGSRQSDRLPQEMTPVTEGSAANLQASFCLNSLSPCRQILIFSVTASFTPLCCSAHSALPSRSTINLHTQHAAADKPMFSDIFLSVQTYLLSAILNLCLIFDLYRKTCSDYFCLSSRKVRLRQLGVFSRHVQLLVFPRRMRR